MNGCLDVLVSAVCVLCVCVLLSVMYVVVCGVLTGPSRCPLSCMYALSPHLTGDLDGHWWDHASWHSSEASPMSLVRHVEPCLDPPLPSLLPLDPPSLSPSLSLSSPHPPFSQSLLSFHVSLVLFTPLHVVFLFFFLFLSHTCRGQSKGKKKNYWADIYVRADTHLIWEAKENGALWGTLIWRGLGMVWTAG